MQQPYKLLPPVAIVTYLRALEFFKPAPHMKEERHYERTMKFKLLSWVHDPLNGTGQVKSFEEMSISGQTHRFMVVSFENPNFLARIPIENLESRGVRSLCTKAKIKEALAILNKPGKKYKMIWSQKTAIYDKKLLSGDICEIAEVVRDLQFSANNIEIDQSYTEYTLYQKAYARLTKEMSLVMHQSIDTCEKRLSKIFAAL